MDASEVDHGAGQAADAPPDAPTRWRAKPMVAVYEYSFRRRRVAEPLGSVRSPEGVAAMLCERVRRGAGLRA